jgi:serine phosphatase RsbU (regulator of sigma subunit)
LEAIHRLLEDRLPEGVYVEGTLARLKVDGEVTVAAAGGTRLLLRRAGQERISQHRLSGSWLGLMPPQAEDQRRWTMEVNDELVLGTDGLFDHLAGSGELGVFASPKGSFTLFEGIHRLLQEALQKQPQKDDITMVLLGRRNEPSKEPPT